MSSEVSNAIQSLASPPVRRELVARALFNKGIALGALSRGEDAIAAHDDLLARFGTATESRK